MKQREVILVFVSKKYCVYTSMIKCVLAVSKNNTKNKTRNNKKNILDK